MSSSLANAAHYRRDFSRNGCAPLLRARAKRFERTAGYAPPTTIMTMRNALISAGFAGFRASGLHRLARVATRGRGVILTFHRVRPWRDATPGYAPNRLLEITPEFLDLALGVVEGQGFELVSLDEARRRIAGSSSAPFAALTFDDGYRDMLHIALPVLERRRAPFTVFCAIGFVESRRPIVVAGARGGDPPLGGGRSRGRRPKVQFRRAHPRGKDCGLRKDLLAHARPT